MSSNQTKEEIIIAEKEQKLLDLRQQLNDLQNQLAPGQAPPLPYYSKLGRIKRSIRQINCSMQAYKATLRRKLALQQNENDNETENEHNSDKSNEEKQNILSDDESESEEDYPNFHISDSGLRRSQRKLADKHSCYVCHENTFATLPQVMSHIQSKHGTISWIKNPVKATQQQINQLHAIANDTTKKLPKQNLLKQISFLQLYGGSANICCICQNEFESFSKVVKHIREYHNNEILNQCKICNKVLLHESGLQKHIKYAHAPQKQFQCHICHKKLAWPSTLLKHIRNVHLKQRNYQCKICLKYYSSAYAVKVHQRIHTGEKPFECGQCNQRFAYKCLLKIHEERQHDHKPLAG